MSNTLKKALLITSLTFITAPFAYAEEPVSVEKQITGYEQVEVKLPVPYIKFDKEDPIFPDGYFERLKATVDGFGEHRGLKIEVVGHSDSARLGAASRAKWGSNLGLSKLRAANAVKEIQKRLNIEGADFISRGAGASEPLVENSSPENKAKNRRGETNFSYEKPIYKVVELAPEPAPTAPVVAPVVVPDTSSESAAREALEVTDEDDNANTLKEALTAVDENYSLIKKGDFGLHYGHSFSYSSADSILLSSQSVGNSNPIDVSRDSRYTHSTSLTGSYGLSNNVTLGASLPFVSTVREGSSAQDRAEDDGIGDISLSLRWQPWPVRLGAANTTFSGSLVLPTGTDPYKIDTENSIATGGGSYAVSLGANFNKTIDPIIAYGGISLSQTFARSGLNQLRGDRFLQEVDPEPTFSYSMGIGYALSYGVSLNMGFQHSFGSETLLTFSDGSTAGGATGGRTSTFESVGGHSALFNISAGFRTSPGTVMSVNVGIGLTRESPDFVLGFSLPFSIEGLKSYFVED